MSDYRENFHKGGSLVFDVGTSVEQRLLVYYLKRKNQQLPCFLNMNQHELFHLYTKSQCCQCGTSNFIQSKCVIKNHQMEQIFVKEDKLPCHLPHFKGKDKFCCSEAKTGIQPDDLDISILHPIITNLCSELFWESCIQKANKTPEEFFNDNIHDLYHLWKKPKNCCMCTNSFNSVNGVSKVLTDVMWTSIYTKNTNPKCANLDSCSFVCKNGLDITILDRRLQHLILNKFSYLKNAIEDLTKQRNNFAHLASGQLSQHDFIIILTESKHAILQIAEFIEEKDKFNADIREVEISPSANMVFQQLLCVLAAYNATQTDFGEKFDDINVNIIELKTMTEEKGHYIQKYEELLRQYEALFERQLNEYNILEIQTDKAKDNLQRQEDQMQRLEECSKRTENYSVRQENQIGRLERHAETAEKILQRQETDIQTLKYLNEKLMRKMNKIIDGRTLVFTSNGSDVKLTQQLVCPKQAKDKGGVDVECVGNKKKRTKRSTIKDKFQSFFERVRRKKSTKSHKKEDDNYVEPDDAFYCGPCGQKIYGGLQKTREHKRTCEHRKERRRRHEQDVVFHEENLSNRDEIRAIQEGSLNPGCLDTEEVHVEDIERSSLLIWAKISRTCFQTKEAFTEAVRNFFEKMLRNNILNAEVETDFKVTVHIMEQTEESDSDDLEGDLYICSRCNAKFSRFKDYYAHKKECNAGTSKRQSLKEGEECSASLHDAKCSVTTSRKQSLTLLQDRNKLRGVKNPVNIVLKQEPNITFSDLNSEMDDRKSHDASTSGYESYNDHTVRTKRTSNRQLSTQRGKRSALSSCAKDTYHTSSTTETSGYESNIESDRKLDKRNEVIQTRSVKTSTKIANTKKQKQRKREQMIESSEDEMSEVKYATQKLNYYEKSCQNQCNRDHFFSDAIQNGLKLSKRCVTRLTDELERTIKHKQDFYTPFLDETVLQSLMKKNPGIYKSGILSIDSSHGATCKVKNPTDGIETILISGRSNCGKTFTDDEVVVEIILKENIQSKQKMKSQSKVYGKILGRLAQHRKSNINHPVFVCELDSFDNDQVKPICKTLPKLQLVRSKRDKSYFTVDQYEYNAERKDLIKKNEAIKITPDRRRKYLFYVVYISWTTIYPTGVAIDTYESSRNLANGINILDLQFEIPTIYKPLTVKRMQSRLEINFQNLKQDRADLSRTCRVFTIDPKGTVVFDDAISVNRLKNGRYCVGVHISDVTAYLEKDDDIDREAKERGTTFFVGEYCDPHYMLPEPLSIETCSLSPGHSRLTLTVFLYFNENLDFEGPRILKSVIKSSAQLTYDHVQSVIEGQVISEFQGEIKDLFKIARRSRQTRLRGAASGIPFVYDCWQHSETETKCFEAYYIIEEFMILANSSVARFLMGKEKIKECIPLRCHDAPNRSRVQDWLKSYRTIIDQVVQLQSKKPTNYNDINLENIARIPRRYTDICFLQKWLFNEFKENVISGRYHEAERLLCMDELHPFQALALDEWFNIQENGEYRCSGYVSKIKGSMEGKHFGLNLYPYVHFTAPIRRFIDIVVHRLLNAALSDQQVPYNPKEVREICNHINKVSHRAKQYETKCKTLLLAHAIKDKPIVTFGFVSKFSDQDICFVLPGLRYLSEDVRTLNINLMDVCCQPDFKRDMEKINLEANREILILNWERRIYSRRKLRPQPKNKWNGYQYPEDNGVQRLDPHQRTEVHGLQRWITYLENKTDLINCSKLFAERNIETNLFKYVPTTFFTEFDVNCELEKRETKQDDTVVDLAPGHSTKNRKANIITKQSCKFSMSFSHGQVVALQLSAQVHRGVLTPYIQFVDMTENVKFCTEHMRDPVGCLEKYSVDKPKDAYRNVDEYRNTWLPMILMESANNAVQSDTIMINEVIIKSKDGGGQFTLMNEFCEERNINLKPLKIGFLDECLPTDDGEFDQNYLQRSDYLCIRCILINKKDQPEQQSKAMSWNKLGPDNYRIWSSHAKINNVISSKNRLRGATTITFEYTPNANLPPRELIQEDTGLNYCVEILMKSALDIRVECALTYLHEANSLSKAIALRSDIPEFDKEHTRRLKAIDKTDVKIGLPKNNERQEKAIGMALRSRFSLIHGPPGTGKTNTAIKLIFLFHDINKRVEKMGGERKYILFCGPSNKSVDLVAAHFMERQKECSPNTAIEYNPKIARLYGGSLANCDFPIPGKFYSTMKGSIDDKPDEKLRPISIHWIIRQEGKPYASEISLLGKQLKDKSKLRIGLITEYSDLVMKATQEELKNYDVIFCTTAMATNSNMFKELKKQIFQVIIDECGMCTEPECIATIISTRAEQVVLIGDHKQLKPVIQCEEAERLGLAKSLFESYQHGKANINQLNTQYRMHKSICEFPSKKFYKGTLITGPSASYEEAPPLQIWGDKIKTRFVFCHVEGTEDMLTVSTGEGNIMSRRNEEEIKQVLKIYKFLYQKEEIFGNKGRHIQAKCTVNIMSQYNAQCKAITKALEREGFNNVNVNTVNGSQGGEWDYVIFSLVRSLPAVRIERYPTLGWSKRNLGFITDENQINVALTRAKKGLFIIGNRHLLSCNSVWNDLISYYASKGRVYDAKDFPKSIPKASNRKGKEVDEDGFQLVKK